MAHVTFTRHLWRYFPTLEGGLKVDAATVEDLLVDIDRHCPGVDHYLRDERGHVRKHVNVFVDGDMLPSREDLSTPLAADAEVHIMQALSGG